MVITSGELCFCEIENVLDGPQPEISRRLSHLKACGLISLRGSKRWVYYKIRDDLDPGVSLLIENVGRTFENAQWTIGDTNRLEKVKAKRICYLREELWKKKV